jgi:anti-sigma-K factor RskA
MRLKTSGRLRIQFEVVAVWRRIRKWGRTAGTAAGIVALAASGVAALAVPAQAAAPTVVSLTFDDGNADQLNAAQIMNATAVSFGLNLFRNGTLSTDDYAMYDTIGAPSL